MKQIVIPVLIEEVVAAIKKANDAERFYEKQNNVTAKHYWEQQKIKLQKQFKELKMQQNAPRN